MTCDKHESMNCTTFFQVVQTFGMLYFIAAMCPTLRWIHAKVGRTVFCGSAEMANTTKTVFSGHVTLVLFIFANSSNLIAPK